MEKTKLIHISDFHNDYNSLEKIINYVNSRRDIDGVFFSGDSLESVLSGKQVGEMNSNLEIIVKGVSEYFEGEFTYKEAYKLAKKSKKKEIKKAIKNYKKIERKYKKAVKIKYKKFKKYVKMIKKKIVMVPGNWDTPMFNRIFRKYSIHKKTKKINGLRIAGYGGADNFLAFMPVTCTMPYNEKKFQNYIKRKNPDIILSHMPPKEIVDGPHKIGSKGLADYVKDNKKRIFTKKKLKAVLCGHAHGYDSLKIGDVMVVNAGNLGKYRNQKHYGTFAEIEIDKNGAKAKHYQIESNEIYEITNDKNNEFQKAA